MEAINNFHVTMMDANTGAAFSCSSALHDFCS